MHTLNIERNFSSVQYLIHIAIDKKIVLENGVHRKLEKVLYAVDELTGLIGAVVLMRPSKSVQDLELKSVLKKYKSPKFAAGCSREVIERGANLLGWELNDLISRTIAALKTFRP